MAWPIKFSMLVMFWLPLLAAGLVVLAAYVPMAVWRRLADWWRLGR